MTYHQFRYYLDFVIYPTLLLALFVGDFHRLMSHPVWWASMFVIGFLTWTLAEYWVHRSLLHGPYWMGIHEYHHNHPKHLTVFPWYQIPGYFIAIYIGTALIARDATTAIFAGIITGWIIFFAMHHTMHHKPAIVEDFARRHNAHHKTTTCNYGITVDFWDRVFGTYRANPVRGPKASSDAGA